MNRADSLSRRTSAKPTVNDIARVAGVSLATVDRVLNERPGVRSVTVGRVRDAVQELGYVRDTAAANLARKRVYGLRFVLPDAANGFVQWLKVQIAYQAGTLERERTIVGTVAASSRDPQDFVRALDATDPSVTDGVAVLGPETPAVRDAIKRVRDRGVAVVALASDLPSSERDHFVGIDNESAGRTAARLMGRFAHGAGPVLVIGDSRLSRDHLERRHGFDSVMSSEFPNLVVLPSVESRDGSGALDRMIGDVFERYPEIRGIYSTAAENACLIRYLAENPRPRGLVAIGHELTPMTRKALHDGVYDAVIGQDGGHLIRSACRILRATADRVPFNELQERIRIDVHLKDNTALDAPSLLPGFTEESE